MNICFLDFETTGVNREKDWPIQIGAILVEVPSFEELGRFASDIKPPAGVKNSPQAYEIHGRSLDYLRKTAPDIPVVVSKFFDTLGTDYAFGGWNINFDLSFMHKICYRSGMAMASKLSSVNYRHVDVQSIASFLKWTGKLPEFSNMHDLCKQQGMDLPVKHNALRDAEVSVELFKLLFEL